MPIPTVEQNAELDSAAKQFDAANVALAAAQGRLDRAISPYVANESLTKPGRYGLVAGSSVHLIVKEDGTAAVDSVQLLADAFKAV